MTLPVTTATTTATTATATTPTTTATATAGAGIAGSGSSITSAAPANAPSTGFSATISAWVTSVVDAIRNCLAKIPGLGFCATTSTVTPQVVTPTVVTPDVAVANVKAIFDLQTDPAATVRPVPAADLVVYALARFGAIVTDADKLDAYGAVISARNTSPAIARQFYDVLPANIQQAIQAKMHIANVVNGQPSSVFNGADHTFGFGAFMIHHEICNDISKRAVALVRDDVLAAAATPVTTTTTP